VNIYSDGTILVTHSGSEIGQGIDTKVAQAVAFKLGAPMSLISFAPTSSFNSPNAGLTGGSVTSELCCEAATKACEIINERLAPVKMLLGAKATWNQLIGKALSIGVNLQAQGDVYPPLPEKAAFGYMSYSACVQEVELDILTGESKLVRSDILFDAGISLNPLIDIGQVEGAFVQGLGLYLTEEVLYDKQGKLFNKSTWEYKPFTGQEIPLDLRVSLLKDAPNPTGFLGSKATSEPPLALSCAALFAIQHAINSFRTANGVDVKDFVLSAPATVDVIQNSCQIAQTSFTF